MACALYLPPTDGSTWLEYTHSISSPRCAGPIVSKAPSRSSPETAKNTSVILPAAGGMVSAWKQARRKRTD